jgi:AAA domain
VNKKSENMGSKTADRLDELLNYVHHVGRLNQIPIFRIEEYKQLNIFEYELKGKIGIQHNIADDDGISIWLRIERLKRLAPPSTPEQIQAWVTVGNDPEINPQVKEKIIKTLPEREAKKLVDEGFVAEIDVTDPLKQQIAEIKMKDVIFRLKSNPQVKTEIDKYLNEQWLPWSEEEKPRRQTIKIYDSLFSLQQTIEAQGDEQPIELVWGIGIARWDCEGHKINHPLIEKPIEIVVDRKDGAILIHPRNADPTLAIEAYFALENPGVDALLRFGKKHFSEMSEDVEFSPYIHESFEPLLRQASTHLSESGTYWPDINPNIENREPNKISETLEVTDSWVIFARPRSATSFVQDIERFQKKLEESKRTEQWIPNPIKRFVTELSDKKPLQTHSGFFPASGIPSISSVKKQKTELFFPKPFNEAQIQIIDRLEQNDGVVVQGPPGTGKTHTIANIICHYLATGRSVLVTSKGEPALSVLQQQIPEELRSLTISLLANERQGMKQLEAAVELLAGLVSQTNLRELKQEAELNELRVKQLKKEIVQIEKLIKEWGLKQLNPVDKKLTDATSEITAMELAQQVISDSGAHEWMLDELGSSEKYIPKFTDTDIANIRNARRKAGKDIVYVGKNLPNVQDLPDSAIIAAIHDDLSRSAKIAEDSKSSHIPPLAVSVEKSVARAKQLAKPLQEQAKLLELFKSHHWLERLFYSLIGDSSESEDHFELFNDLLASLSTLMERRQQFVKTLVEIPDPSSYSEYINAALNNLAEVSQFFK